MGIKSNSIIKKGFEGICILGMYKYKAGVYFDFNSYKIMIILGCHNRTLEIWEQEGTLGFNNNLKEFSLCFLICVLYICYKVL